MTAKQRAPGPRPGSQAPHIDSNSRISLAPAPNLGKAASTEEAAVRYARLGLSVIPLRPQGKEPIGYLLPIDRRTGEHSWRPLIDRPASESEVRSWFEQVPDANIGILTGLASGVITVDLDGSAPSGLHLPPTVAQHTSRGTHFLYRYDQPLAGRKLPFGDLKADGGYVVAAPSVHPDGTVYAWFDFCSPGEHEFAELPPDLLEQLDRYASERAKVTQKKNSSTRSPAPSDGLSATKGNVDGALTDWMSREDVAKAILAACGVPHVSLRKGFRCPLPGHEEAKPSAALYRHEADRTIGFYDFHRKSGPAWFSLAEVFAAVRTGEVRKLGKGEQVTWFLRALIETGFMKAPSALAPRLPRQATPAVHAAYEGFKLLLSVRTLYDPQQTAAPYAWDFAAGWCGKSRRHTGIAIKWLIERGYLVRVEARGKGLKAGLLALGSPKGESSV